MSSKSGRDFIMRSATTHPLDRRTMLSGLAALTAIGVSAGLAHAEASSMIEERWTAGGLVGTFARPRSGPERGPAVLILAGSGGVARDGICQEYLLLAQGLAAAGIRSLRYDKRGIGESADLVEREDDVVVQDFVDDAVMAARDLAARPDVSAVFVAGHSEGSLLATLAAQKTPLAGIALLAGPGRPLHVILREQLMAIPLPPSQEHYRQEALEILDKLARGERVPNVPPAHMALFRPSVQPFLLSIFPIDPAAELGRLTLPTLIMRGACDIQVSQADFDALTRARPDAAKLLLPLTNHVFKPAPANISDRAAQIKSYNPAAPLVPGLVPAVVDFVSAAGSRRGALRWAGE